MWALRRASSSFKAHNLTAATFCLHRISGSGHVYTRNVEGNSFYFVFPFIKSQKPDLHRSFKTTSVLSEWKRDVASQSDSKSGEAEDDSEDLFSEIEIPPCNIAANHDIVSDGSHIEDNYAASLGNNLITLPELFVILKGVPPSEVPRELNKWVEDGKDLDQEIARLTLFHLRRTKLYRAALKVYNWLRSHNKFEFNERDYALLLDLIAKVRGLDQAEQFIVKVPVTFRGEVLYRNLLANYVAVSNYRKSEELFNKMKHLGFPISEFSCNQLLLLYKKGNREKIADVLQFMEKENIKPSLFTYNVLIYAKGISKDFTGMEQVLESMKVNGFLPDSRTKATMARFYALGGLTEKAELILKEMEGENVNKQRLLCGYILPIYAHLGKPDEVLRLWKICEENTQYAEYLAAINAWGTLKRVKEAEIVFDKMKAPSKNVLLQQYSALLRVYVVNKEVDKAKDLIEKMSESGIDLTAFTWNYIVKLYVQNDEVEKADSLLSNAVERTNLKPLFSSYVAILDQYAKRGDVYNAEKIFWKMKESGYEAGARHFSSLLSAYVASKTAAYGMKERLKAHNISPNPSLAFNLMKVDPFKHASIL